MAEPTARELEQRAQEASAMAARMRNIMARLVLTYERLAKSAADHEANGRNAPRKQSRDEIA